MKPRACRIASGFVALPLAFAQWAFAQTPAPRGRTVSAADAHANGGRTAPGHTDKDDKESASGDAPKGNPPQCHVTVQNQNFIVMVDAKVIGTDRAAIANPEIMTGLLKKRKDCSYDASGAPECQVKTGVGVVKSLYLKSDGKVPGVGGMVSNYAKTEDLVTEAKKMQTAGLCQASTSVCSIVKSGVFYALQVDGALYQNFATLGEAKTEGEKLLSGDLCTAGSIPTETAPAAPNPSAIPPTVPGAPAPLTVPGAVTIPTH